MTQPLRTALAALALSFGMGLTGWANAHAVVISHPPVADHHLHIFSAEGSRVLDLICKALGPKGCPPQRSTAPSTGADVLMALDKAGIRDGVLLSGGYFFGSPEVADQHLDVAKGMRDENTFIVGEAKASCGRLSAFVSVPPLSPDAVAEIHYWGKKGGATGLKLHLGSARFDFRDPDQVGKLAAIFKAAGEEHLAIVIHMQTRLKDYGAEDAKIFLRDVYPMARGSIIQVAHAAGSGGVDDGELAALGAFAEAIAANPRSTKNLYFDLAMVPDLFANEGKIPASPAHVAALEDLMHKIGLKRFLLGSDYVLGLDLKAYYANEQSSLGLNAADWRTLASNLAPYIRSKSARHCTVAR